jgi:hypothetical protein
MKWLILVVMMGMYDDGSQDTYLFFDPHFETLEQCQEYVYNESASIRSRMMFEYQGKSIERVFCIREDKLGILGQEPGISI